MKRKIPPSSGITELEDVISTLEMPVDSSCSNELEQNMLLSLRIDPVDVVSFPICNVVATLLRSPEHAIRTATDSAAPNAWLVPASRVTIGNPSWKSSALPEILAEVEHHLYLGSRNMVAHFGGLLLQESGAAITKQMLPLDSYQCHDGWFGHLVIMLPSIYTGSALIVENGNRSSHRMDYAAQNEFSSFYAALHSDCDFHFETATSGRRVCLLYHLKLEGALPAPSLLTESGGVQRIKTAIERWTSEQNSPRRFFYGLSQCALSTPVPTMLRDLTPMEDTVVNLLRGNREKLKIDIYIAILKRFPDGRVFVELCANAAGDPCKDLMEYVPDDCLSRRTSTSELFVLRPNEYHRALVIVPKAFWLESLSNTAVAAHFAKLCESRNDSSAKLAIEELMSRPTFFVRAPHCEEMLERIITIDADGSVFFAFLGQQELPGTLRALPHALSKYGWERFTAGITQVLSAVFARGEWDKRWTNLIELACSVLPTPPPQYAVPLLSHLAQLMILPADASGQKENEKENNPFITDLANSLRCQLLNSARDDLPNVLPLAGSNVTPSYMRVAFNFACLIITMDLSCAVPAILRFLRATAPLWSTELGTVYKRLCMAIGWTECDKIVTQPCSSRFVAEDLLSLGEFLHYNSRCIDDRYFAALLDEAPVLRHPARAYERAMKLAVAADNRDIVLCLLLHTQMASFNSATLLTAYKYLSYSAQLCEMSLRAWLEHNVPGNITAASELAVSLLKELGPNSSLAFCALALTQRVNGSNYSLLRSARVPFDLWDRLLEKVSADGLTNMLPETIGCKRPRETAFGCCAVQTPPM